jgi:hypothetical protein
MSAPSPEWPVYLAHDYDVMSRGRDKARIEPFFLNDTKNKNGWIR